MGIRFSYKPYLTFDKKEYAELYIVRLAPAEDSVELEWLGYDTEFTVKVRQNGKEIKSVRVVGKRAKLTGLKKDTEYSLTVESERAKSLTRLFRTGNYRGTVVNYLHPDDRQYENYGTYLGSPGRAVQWQSLRKYGFVQEQAQRRNGRLQFNASVPLARRRKNVGMRNGPVVFFLGFAVCRTGKTFHCFGFCGSGQSDYKLFRRRRKLGYAYGID